MAIERSSVVEPLAAGATDADAPVHVITLNHGEHQDSTIYRFDKGCYLQFVPGPSLLGRKVFLYTNYVMNDKPNEKGDQSEFVRNQYYLLEWRFDLSECEASRAETGAEEPALAGDLVTDRDVCCRIHLTRPGAFHFYYVYESAESGLGPQGSGWFGVAPALRAGGAELALHELCCQTVLAKCLGVLPRWEPTLRVAAEAGYNVIHFTPIQELGGSQSSYSLAGHLRLDPRYSPKDGPAASFADVDNLITKMRNEWKVLSICDVVLNHAANETEWLWSEPGASYNCATCPHLRPAALLDAALAHAGAAAAGGRWAAAGLPCRVTGAEHLQALRRVLAEHVLPPLRLHEMYEADVDAILQQFCCIAKNKVPSPTGATGSLQLVPDPLRRRKRASIDMDLAIQMYNVYRPECESEEARVRACAEPLRASLRALNAAARAELDGHLQAAVDNVVAGVSYFRVQSDGPKLEEVSEKHPLIPRYFTSTSGVSPAEAEALIYGSGAARFMAHNGWLLNADPLQDFASSAHARPVYLRRELIAWGDSVKLRYGEKPEDSPFLWRHMREYVELVAELFAGVRLDNCHSTPLHVAEYMLDAARSVNPDLVVVAELFTNSDHVDNIFVNRLGITALIREAMAAWDPREQGRLLHRFGGRPVGSFLLPPAAAPRHAAPSRAPALLMDLTHDNPSPVDKRSVHDMLPTAAVVTMAACAVGSTRGYDELVPHHIHVVDEERPYAEWGGAEGVGADTGLMAARRELNLLHRELARDGYSELYVDQLDEHVVAVTRHRPASRHSVLLVAHNAFAAPDPHAPPRQLPPLRFEGQLQEILFEMSVRPREQGRAYERRPHVINGLENVEIIVRRAVPLAGSDVFRELRDDGAFTELEFRGLRPGTVAAVRCAPRPACAAALSELHAALQQPAAADPLRLAASLRALDLADLNAVLYRCDAEERDITGAGVYSVPGHGDLCYAGLQGADSVLEKVVSDADLAHPLCDNLRAGDWLAEFTCARLERDPRLQPLGQRVRAVLRPLRQLPRYLQPAYFAALHARLTAEARRAALARLAGGARAGRLRRALALTSVQLLGAVPSATMPAAPPRCVTLSAGLPHFAVGYMRCWGRDTFVALRGLLLLPGRHEEARQHLIGFGACLRHGLVPNLLDGGRRPRLNCRDAVWWWLRALRDYCLEAPGGSELLSAPVPRLFPTDDAEPAAAPVEQPLYDVMQEALDTHFQGLTYRERNAGRDIDAHMTDKGFNVQIGIDPETGFPFGGNDANCGTWMDKMGSSERAGNRGRPATPRDGSAVELVGLAYSAAAWLAAEHAAGRVPHAGVARLNRDGTRTAWTWRQWADRIRRNFERHFWVPSEPSAADARPDLVHRRAIYKDSHGASQPWADYQLRCNFPIAMVVAPDLFDPKHAWAALDNLERLLLGPLGVKTLDPADWAYRGDYDNSNDSTDPTVAHGFNYHQGPEWVWPIGFYIRARLQFAQSRGCHARTVAAAYATLGPHAAELTTSPWRGLPELTGAGGTVCRDSCPTQAWSSGTVLEALHALHAARRARPLPPD